MANETLTAAMPSLDLTAGAQIVLEAIDPTTGAAVAGVVAEDMVVYAKSSDDETLVEAPVGTLYLSQSDGDLLRPNPVAGRGD